MLEFGYYNMDCMEGMAQMPDKYIDLAIVDPPYGINVGNQIGSGSRAPATVYKSFDDTCIPPKEYFNELERVSKNRIIWGGNYFIKYLDNTSCFIVWDKENGQNDFSDCELAWASFKTSVRIFRFKWAGFLQGNMKNKEIRIHPTQKPVALYKWLLQNYANPGDLILDTHVGSASSLIACEELGFQYIGFEIDPEYYRLSCERIKRFNDQIRFDFNV